MTMVMINGGDYDDDGGCWLVVVVTMMVDG